MDKNNVPEVLDYIHHNPVKGKWSLIDDFTEFKYSSAGFYELGKVSIFQITDYREIYKD